MSVLFINACVRENSRTLVLAKNVMKDMIGEIVEVNLNLETIEPLDRALLEKRERLIKDGKLDAGDLVGFIGGSFSDEVGATYIEFIYV